MATVMAIRSTTLTWPGSKSDGSDIIIIIVMTSAIQRSSRMAREFRSSTRGAWFLRRQRLRRAALVFAARDAAARAPPSRVFGDESPPKWIRGSCRNHGSERNLEGGVEKY